MRFIRLFGRWYVARNDRRGCEVNDKGEVVLRFPGLVPGATVCIDEHRCRVLGEDFVLGVHDGVHKVSVMLPDGMVEEVEDIIVEGGTVLPGGFNRDDFMLELAERLQALEAAEAEDRDEIQKFNDKKSGKLLLGGTKR